MAGHDVQLDYHRVMLTDAVRMEAYDRAIRAVVRPGDVVLDIGTGTGVLAMLAARQGARVHAVEIAPVVAVARELVRHNGLAGQVTVHGADLRSMRPVEPVDVVLGEYMGRFLADDWMVDAVEAARRWAKPGARWLPSAVALRLAPVQSALPQLHAYDAPICGLDLSPMAPRTLRTCYAAALEPGALLADPATYLDWAPATDPPVFDAEVAFTVARAGVLDALAGWFDARLAPDVTLSTRPGVVTHWGQYAFPLPSVAVEPGDEVRARVWLDQGLWRWVGAVRRDGWALRTFDLVADDARR